MKQFKLPFVNRTEEIGFLEKFFGRGDESVLVLAAAGGIGKSRLTDHVAEKLQLGERFVRVRQTEDATDITPDYSYFRKAITSCDNAFRNIAPEFGLEEFLRTNHEENSLGSIARRIIKENIDAHWLLRSANAIFRIAERGQNTTTMQLMLSTTSQLVQFGYDYLDWLIHMKRLVIAIENAQHIDAQSLHLFSQLVRNQSNCKLVFEFTNDTDRARTVGAISNSFEENDTAVLIRNLSPLNPTDLVAILEKRPSHIRKILSNLYISSKGSLRPFVELEILYLDDIDGIEVEAIEKINSANDLIAVRLHRLDDSERLFLCLLSENGGEIEFDLVVDIMSCNAERFAGVSASELADALVQSHYVEIDKSTLSVISDGVLRVVRSNPEFELISQIAADMLCKYYANQNRSILQTLTSPLDRLTRLLSLHIRLGRTGEAVAGLSEIKSFVADFPSALSIAECLFRVAVSILDTNVYVTNSKSTDIILEIIVVMLICGAPEKGIELISKYPLKGSAVKVIHAALLDYAGRYDESLDLALEMKAATKPLQNIDRYINISLLIVSGYRGANRWKDCRKAYADLLELDGIEKSPNYGHVLRSAQIGLPVSRAVPIQMQSIQWFDKQGTKLQRARARIALSASCGDLGRLSDVESALQEAEILLTGQSSEAYALQNNYLAAQLYDPRPPNRDLMAKVEQVYIQCAGPFERLILLNNLLLAHTMHGETEVVESEISRIRTILQGSYPPDLEIRRISFWNLYIAGQSLGYNRMASVYRKEAEGIEYDYNSEFWQAKFGGMGSNNPNYEFRLKFRHCPVFMSFWTVDDDSILQ